MASNKKKLIIILVAAAVLAVAAVVIYHALVPKVPNEKKMARIMADIYTADAILQERSSTGAKDKTIENTYHSVLAHYGLTKAQYDSAVAWYSAEPKKFAAVYERVVAILTTREDAVRIIAEQVDSIARRIDAINDSLTTDFIGSKLTISLPLSEKADSVKSYLKPSSKKYTRVEKSVDLDSVSGGHIDISFRYTIAKPGTQAQGKYDKQTNPHVTPMLRYPDGYIKVLVSYADTTEQRDSTVITVSRKVAQREAKLSVNLKDSVPATRVDLIFFENVNLKDMEMSLRDIKAIYKPYDVQDTTNYDNIIPSLFAY